MEKDEAPTKTPKASGTPKALGTPKAPESPAKNDGNPIEDQKEEGDSADQKEKDKDVTDGGDEEDSTPLEPVEIPDPHPTLDKLSKDIDRCISTLPRPSEKDESQQEEKDNANNEAKDAKGGDEKDEKHDKEEEKVTDDKVEKEEEKGENQDVKEGEKNDKDEIKDDEKDEKELGDEKKDEKETEEAEYCVIEKEKDLVPEELIKLIEKFLNWVDDICCEGRCRWGTVPADDESFMDAVDRMAKLRESLLSVCSMGLKFQERHGGLINRLSGIQHRAMAYLEEEFRVLLEESKTEADQHTTAADHKDNTSGTKGKNDQDSVPESEPETQVGVEYPGYPHEAVSNLNKIAKKMIFAGYEFECCEVYIISRRHAFDENLHRLGLEKHSIDDVQRMHWESLEREIVSWVKALKQCVAFYFSGERKLAESVFSEHPEISSCLFSNLSRGVMIQLLNFAEGIAMAKRAAEKLFKTLDMYEAVKGVVPKMDELFPEACVNDLKTETTTVLARLGEAAICIFCDLENSIKAETGRNLVPGGAVHPLTRYTMNYLRYACEYKDTLELVFKEHAKIERTDSTSKSRDEYDASDTSYAVADDESPFAVQLARVMALLDSNLEAKSKLYKDVALSSIFMMNNGRYIMQKIKGSPEINACMGDTWCRKRSSELRQYHKNYQRETWSRLLSFLSHEGLSNHGKVQKPVLKERFKSFNAMFDEIHKTQSTWVVSDEQLQSELRVSISAVVIPAYRSFLGRFAQVLDPGRQTEKYVKFQPDDIETYIDELFDGNPAQIANPNSNSSIFNRRRP
ncbi:hypothetical protein ACLB2K_053765 [Fragaria x ananassa]